MSLLGKALYHVKDIFDLENEIENQKSLRMKAIEDLKNKVRRYYDIILFLREDCVTLYPQEEEYILQETELLLDDLISVVENVKLCEERKCYDSILNYQSNFYEIKMVTDGVLFSIGMEVDKNKFVRCFKVWLVRRKKS